VRFAAVGCLLALVAPPPPPYQPAVRECGNPDGLYCLPFAPETLDDCADAQFYRIQFGLPERFDRLAWRESRCTNTAHTYCCWGYLQLHVYLHLRDPRIGWRYRETCQVFSRHDIFGDSPLAKQKQMCAVKQLFDVVGLSPWRTR
jgi:hypothetical protein